MNEFTGMALTLSGFVLGWLGCEAYLFFKNEKDGRWH